VLLWRIARDVVLLAETPASKRAGLFSPEASEKRSARLLRLDLPDDVTGPVDTVAAQLARPEKADAGIITWCCRRVAQWAAANHAPGTAIFFAQAAALTSPEDAAPALDAGRIALANGQRHRGESWLRRTVGLARRSRQWDSYGAAYLALGDFYQQARASDRARASYRQAYATARRYGMRECGALAAYGVFRVAFEAGATSEAEAYARLAQRASTPDHSATPRLLLDTARFWLEVGKSDEAVWAIRRVMRHVDGLPAEERVCGWALTARVFAAAPSTADKARQAWEQAHALIARTAPESAVRAAIDLAHAAFLLGDDRQSNTARAIALGIAATKEYARVRAALGAIRSESTAPGSEAA
jgi:tetratricopeptide (TPR) repeat protein